MADGRVMEQQMSEFMVVIDQSGWREYFPHFSSEARIVALYLEGQPNPLDVDLELASFSWPKPVGNTTVGVAEPDLSGFKSRLKNAGIQIPSFDDESPDFVADIDDLLVDEDVTAPGAVVDLSCPSCELSEMYVISELDQISLSKDYASVTGKSWYISQMTGAPHVDGVMLSGARCPACLCTFLLDIENRVLIAHDVEIG